MADSYDYKTLSVAASVAADALIFGADGDQTNGTPIPFPVQVLADWIVQNGTGGPLGQPPDGNYGDISVSGGGATWAINPSVVTYSKIQNVSNTSRVLGRKTAGAGAIEELDGADVAALVDVYFLTPTEGNAAYQPLDSDLTAIAALATAAYGRGLLELADTAALTAEIDEFTDALSGAAPASGGGTDNFLRADGTWAAPPGSGVGSLDDLTDVTLTALGDGELLVSSGGVFINQTFGELDLLTATAAAAAYQPLDSDLTAIAALATTAAGRSALTVADPDVDRMLFWDDDAGTVKLGAIADFAVEATPGAGDYVFLQRAGTDDIALVAWADLPAGSGSPGGVDTQIQYNNGGAFGGAELYYDDLNERLGVRDNAPVSTVAVHGEAYASAVSALLVYEDGATITDGLIASTPCELLLHTIYGTGIYQLGYNQESLGFIANYQYDYGPKTGGASTTGNWLTFDLFDYDLGDYTASFYFVPWGGLYLTDYEFGGQNGGVWSLGSGFWSFGVDPTGSGGTGEIVVDSNTNRVGINNAAPDETLDITGTLRASGAAEFGDAVQLTGGALLENVVALTDGASVALDASLGNVFTLTAAGDRTISAPTNPTNGQRIVIEHTASGADRTLTLTTGSAGAFKFGNEITALSATTSGTTDYIGAVYRSTDDRWHVVAYVTGY